jgi:hypothetical protein
MDPERPHPLRTLAVRIVGVSLGLVLLYVLSIGPMLYLVVRESGYYEQPRWFVVTYAPLGTAAKKLPVLGTVLKPYVAFWTDLGIRHGEQKLRR